MMLDEIMLEELFRKGKPKADKVACLYSGGIDSATANYFYGGDRFTVVWEGFKTKDDDNFEKKILITKKQVEDNVDDIFKCFDRPVVETGIFPLYFAYKYLAELGYKDIVTGDGGDEIFLGYKWDKLAWINGEIVEHEIVNHLYGKHVYIAKSLAQRFGVTIHSPFLNPQVVKFVYNLPLQQKVDLLQNKKALYKMMEGKIEL